MKFLVYCYTSSKSIQLFILVSLFVGYFHVKNRLTLIFVLWLENCFWETFSGYLYTNSKDTTFLVCLSYCSSTCIFTQLIKDSEISISGWYIWIVLEAFLEYFHTRYKLLLICWMFVWLFVVLYKLWNPAFIVIYLVMAYIFIEIKLLFWYLSFR